MKGNKDNGFRLVLGDELAAKLEDFRAAYYHADKTEIIRAALDAYIDSTLANEPERRRRYEDARRRRIGGLTPLRLVAKRQSPKGRTSRSDRS